MLVAHLLGKMQSKEVQIMATSTTKNQSWVQETPGVCGGRACIRNTRITVWGVVNSRRLGRIAKLAPGQTVPIVVIGQYRRSRAGSPRVRDRL